MVSNNAEAHEDASISTENFLSKVNNSASVIC
uniref:Uncharacterized protein n=1 Tax=Nelumbo nucifera TaxID=4432 RepID=A0A822YS02_NELNU|nr:TPA_asm: hypothetical protein HUJ06_004829 [Nelumbo nucifera]